MEHIILGLLVVIEASIKAGYARKKAHDQAAGLVATIVAALPPTSSVRTVAPALPVLISKALKVHAAVRFRNPDIILALTPSWRSIGWSLCKTRSRLDANWLVAPKGESTTEVRVSSLLKR